jgi:hypothetical protein
MHDRERRGDGNADLHDLGQRELAFLQHPIEGGALQVLHREPCHPALGVDGNRMEAYYVGVLHSTQGARLLQHLIDAVFARARVRLQREQLDCYDAQLAPRVLFTRGPDGREPAAPKLPDERELPESARAFRLRHEHRNRCWQHAHPAREGRREPAD